MNVYSYTAVTPAGARETGTLRAKNVAQVLDQLAGRRLTPLAVEAGAAPGSWWSREIHLFGTPTKQAVLEEFFNTLSLLLRAKLSLPKALAFCAETTRDRALRQALELTRASIEDGATLEEALDEHGAPVPSHLRAILSIGDRANALEQTSAAAADMLRQTGLHRRQLVSSLIYPSILGIMAVLVLSLLVFYLAPALLPVFSTAGIEPPLALFLLEAVRSALTSFSGVATIVTVTLGLIAGAVFLKRKATRIGLDRFIPALGTYRRRRESLRFCQTCGLLLKSGATITQALAVCQDASADPASRAMLATVAERVSAGSTLTTAVAAQPLIEPAVRTLIEAGERTNRLPEVLDLAAQDLAAKSNEATTRLLGLVTPLLTLLIGLMVGSIIVATISGILALNDIAF